MSVWERIKFFEFVYGRRDPDCLLCRDFKFDSNAYWHLDVDQPILEGGLLTGVCTATVRINDVVVGQVRVSQERYCWFFARGYFKGVEGVPNSRIYNLRYGNGAECNLETIAYKKLFPHLTKWMWEQRRKDYS